MRIFILSLAFLLYILNPHIALSDEQYQDSPKWRGKSPYGDYCQGKKWGWYGAKKKVKDAKEAENIIKEIFSSDKDVKIVNIREKRFFFEAEIRDKKNNLVDIVIIDKRTGRIRSIY